MLVVRGLVVGLASVALAGSALNAAHAGKAGLRVLYGQHTDPGQRVVAQIEALRRQLVVLVPPGARILIGDVPPKYLAWQQRIAEVATLEHRRVAADPTSADYLVSIVEDPTAPDGSGLRLVAEDLR